MPLLMTENKICGNFCLPKSAQIIAGQCAYFPRLNARRHFKRGPSKFAGFPISNLKRGMKGQDLGDRLDAAHCAVVLHLRAMSAVQLLQKAGLGCIKAALDI